MANSDEVKLIGTPGSLFTSRIEWALALKGVKYEFHEENLLNKSPLLLNSNPIHKKVPVLIHNGNPIVESLLILEYIDETWKDNPLLPQDPYDRSGARFWAKFIDEKCIFAVWGASRAAEGEEKEKAIESAQELLALVEKQIEGKRFFNGEKIGYLDLVMGWGTHCLSVLEELGGMKVLEPEKFPALHAWTENFMQVPAIGSTTAREIVFNYFQAAFDYLRSIAAAASKA